MKKIELEEYNQKRHDCWNGALHAFGYAYLFSKKAELLKKILNLNTFLGILIPLIIGGVVMSYGLQSSLLKLLLTIVIPFSLLQLILSLYIVSYNLEEKYSYFLESAHDNSQISKEYECLGKYPPENIKDLNIEMDKIKIKRNNRDSLDNKYPISDKDKRMGMRYSLRNFKRSCAGCNKIPIDMKSTDCGVCGNF